MTEFGIVMEPSPGNTARLAAEAEQLGFDILLSPDTQNLSPDRIGQLNLAGARTQRLCVGTGVTNPITRDPAVMALYLLTISLLGLSLGPTAVALLTDYVFKDPATIDWSISCVVIALSLFSAIMLWRCLQPFTEAVRDTVN